MTLFAEMSQATTDATKSPAAVAASKIYDIFLWSDAGTLRATRGPAWSSDTSRGTGVGTSEIDFTTKFPTNKIAITNGPAANRGVLVGSVRSDGSSQLKDALAFRWVSNIYNPAKREMFIADAAASWAYTTQAYRQANANAANQLDFLHCLDGIAWEAILNCSWSHNVAGGAFALVAIAIDSTTTPHASNTNGLNQPTTAGFGVQTFACASGYAGIGRHVAVWIEQAAASGTTNFNGTGAVAGQRSGLRGSIWG